MLKTVFAATAVLAFATLGACSQQPPATNTATNAEEVGERADTAYEQNTTGQTKIGDGPMENAGERVDNAAREAGAKVTPDAPPPLDNNPG